MVFFTLALLCLFKVNIFAQEPFVCQGQYFLSLTPPESESSQLFRILTTRNGNSVGFDTLSKDLTQIVNGMGYRITDNFIYGVNPFTANLSRIGNDGIAVPLGIPEGIPEGPVYFAGDITPDGKYLLLIGVSIGISQLIKVDLDDPNYAVSVIPLQRDVEVLDIAFDPFSGLLYGHDSRLRRIVIIDPDTGEVNINFITVPQVSQLGALFFDSFGNLYGYGAFTSTLDRIVGINKTTGAMRNLAVGPPTVGQDGCACPYTIELQKTVTPDTAFQCTEVVYNFIISNASGATRNNIDLFDTLPKDIIPTSIINNPFGGTTEINGNIFSIQGMTVPTGVDTIQLGVTIGQNAKGDYKNQAFLFGLPVTLGAFTKSDNPFTFVEDDSTLLHVVPRDLGFIQDSLAVCKGESLIYDVDRQGLQYLWSDGSTEGRKELIAPGNYTLTVSDVCDEFIFDIEVTEIITSVDITDDFIEISLGESFNLSSTYINYDDRVNFQWLASQDGEFSCPECEETEVFSLRDESIYLIMTNAEGCQAIDSVAVRVERDYTVYSPNIISANGDNNNDIFYLSGDAEVSEGVHLTIFDRWGSLMFESKNFRLNDPEAGWDGRLRGEYVEQGVFVWTAMIRFINGTERIFSGDITVVRTQSGF